MKGKGEKNIYILNDEPKSSISTFAQKEEREADENVRSQHLLQNQS